MNHQPFITKVLNEAAKIAINNSNKISSITTKTSDNNQVLTEADLAIGKFIVNQITNTYPQHNIIDEEAGVINNNSSYTWVVDPIDGTSNYANGLPTYGIMMGLLNKSEAIAGGIILPAFNQLYIAQKGQGAFCNGQIIQVSSENKLLSSLVAYGIDGHQENPQQTINEVANLGKIILKIRNLRTTNSAYDMVQVASGKYGAFLNQTTKIWDNVALQPIVEEAGGIVTDFWGTPMDYSSPLSRINENFTICAGAPIIHKQLQEIIHKKFET